MFDSTYQLHPDAHLPINDSEFADKERRLHRQAQLEIYNREVTKACAEWAKKPPWVKMAEEGDYMADGSDLQGWT